jgi:hypothetical protein
MKIKYSLITVLLAGYSATAHAQSMSQDRMNEPGVETASSVAPAAEIVISRTDYIRRLQGFWLGQCIANWTGIITENEKKAAPFYTDEDWAVTKNPKGELIDWVLERKGKAWSADDDTDIEYIYHHTMYDKKKSILSPEEIRDAWINHIYVCQSGDTGYCEGKEGEPSWLWGSNRKAFDLMYYEGMLPPATSSPENNSSANLIDAQLTTEIFGLYAPARPDVAMKMADLPIRTVGYHEAEWISQFYIIMHSLALYVDPDLSMQEKTVWLAEEARERLPDDSVSAHMYDFIKTDYANNPDKDNWEKTRDAVYQNYQVNGDAGYSHKSVIASEINFAAGMVSLFYGEGDYKRTIQIGVLCGWDSDNPTATWGGLLGFLIGIDGVKNQFPDKQLSDLYEISARRINFPDYTPDQPGEDTFELMAITGAQIIDRVVVEEMNGRVDLVNGAWTIPDPGVKHIAPAEYFSR